MAEVSPALLLQAYVSPVPEADNIVLCPAHMLMVLGVIAVVGSVLTVTLTLAVPEHPTRLDTVTE